MTSSSCIGEDAVKVEQVGLEPTVPGTASVLATEAETPTNIFFEDLRLARNIRREGMGISNG